MKCVVPFIILFVAALARKPVNFVIFNPDEMRAESLGIRNYLRKNSSSKP